MDSKAISKDNNNLSTDEDSVNDLWAPVKRTYKIIKVVGQGTFAQVVKAVHLVTGQVYAIKLLNDI